MQVRKRTCIDRFARVVRFFFLWRLRILRVHILVLMAGVEDVFRAFRAGPGE